MAGMKLVDGKRDLWDVYSHRGVLVARSQPLDIADVVLRDVQSAEDKAALGAEKEK